MNKKNGLEGKNYQRKPNEILRQRAEEQAGLVAAEHLEQLSQEDIAQVLHELRVHQIELEMQNEELRRTQVALEAARARYFDLYELAPVGYMTLDRQGIIQEVNLTAANLLGQVRSTLVNKPLNRFILSNDQDIYYLHNLEMWKTGASMVCEVRMSRPLPMFFWARLEMSLVLNDEGSPLACRMALSDCSKQKRAEEMLQARYEALQEAQQRLVQSEKLASVGQLVASVARELNKPLTAVVASSQMLQQTNTDTNTEKQLQIIEQEAEQAARIVNGLLDFSRQRQVEVYPTQLKPLLEKSLELTGYDLRTRNIEARLQAAPELPLVNGNPQQLTQVFMNLITNAWQAIGSAHPRGLLTITTESGPPRFHRTAPDQPHVIRVLFEDNGPGIPQAVITQIFDPFFSTKPAGAGSGMGLAICHGIIEDHGGHIWAENRPEGGGGARFIIELPAIAH